MKTLETSFVSRGHRHELVRRANRFAIYKRWSTATEWAQPMPHYEVIRIGRQEAGVANIGGTTVRLEEKELYPMERTWGTDGWTFLSAKKAEAKFRNLVKRHGDTAMA